MNETLADFMMMYKLDSVRGRVYLRFCGRLGTLLLNDEILLKYSEYIVYGLGTDKQANLFIYVKEDRRRVI